MYCEDDTYPTKYLWTSLLKRTYPIRLTGAPGPNAPPMLHRSHRLTLATFSRDWVRYLRELRRAPHLTGVQIAKFVRWVASAHSWYKHVPLQEAAIFSLVLDFTAGMKHTPEGILDQREGDARTHYSWLHTRAYREAFGILTYRDALPAFVPGCASGPRSVSVQRTNAERIWVPANVVEVGSCHVTAACHGRAESYQIYHHPYEAYSQARLAGILPPPSRQDALPKSAGAARPSTATATVTSCAGTHECRKNCKVHSYSYLTKDEQKRSLLTLPTEVLLDFERLHDFHASPHKRTAEAQRGLIHMLFPRLSHQQVAKLHEKRVWRSPWQRGGAFLDGPNVVVTAQKAREWQRMFDRAKDFCELIYGEPINMEGVRPCTMTCLALESLPLPVFDIMAT